MKKRAMGILLALSITLSMGAPALAVNTDDTAGDTSMTQEEALHQLLSQSGMTAEQLGTDDDYVAFGKSLGMINDSYNADSTCTQQDYDAMQKAVQPLYDAIQADQKQPLFVNGEAQPIFPYTSGMVENDEDYSNADSNILRYSVYVETNYDTDGDGKRDLVKALVQLPRAAAEGDYKAATIYEARPYITGCTDNGYDRGFDYQSTRENFDINQMYSQPDARTAAGTATTMETAANAKASEWYYVSPYESYPGSPFYDYEDLDWYDYFLVRGYAVVEVGGLGTLGSEGLETCGTDLETDAFKCVIEWLTGDRVAYTDRTNNITIQADWSNGKVGMTGRSYGGTTDFSVASTGVKGLETIVPVAGIASWYEYTNSQGISTGRNPAYSDNLGLFCAGRYIDEEDWNSIADTYRKYLSQIYYTQLDLNGNYGDHWANRDYTVADGKSADTYNNFQCPALIVHGLNDNNVRTKQFELMYQSFKQAGQNVKLLLHQGEHITPDYDSHKTSLPIDGASYNGILNKWFSHYLYGQDNGAENMSAVTVQSNVDGSWTTLDQWENNNELTLSCASDADTTTINSDLAAAGVNRSNFQSKLTAGSTSVSSMYTMDVAEDTDIQGTTAVHIKAAPIQHYTAESTTAVQAKEETSDEDAVSPRGAEHEDIMNPANIPAIDVPAAQKAVQPRDGEDDSRSALMMGAMLVDMADEPFTVFPASRTEVKTGEKSWVGGGLDAYDVVGFRTSEAKYKVIAQGWMDLANPDAGFDSASAANEIKLEDGVYHDYTLYLQPTRYTVQAGHKLALVIFTYDPNKASYSENYAITIDNTASNAVIPVNDRYTVTYADGTNGTVSGSVASGSVVSANTKVTLTATPNAGYRFSSWTVNGAPVFGSATADFTITTNTTISANFVRNSSGGGSSSSGSSNSGNTSNGNNNTNTGNGNNTNTGDNTNTGSTWSNPFADVQSNSWYYNAVKFANENGLMSGIGATEFAPNASTNRGMIVSILWRIENSPASSASASFADVAANAYYAQAVDWAANNNIVSGYNSTSFSPNDNITREQLASILYRYAQYKGMDTVTLEENLSSFSDASEISAYAIPALNWAVGQGLMSGVSTTTLNPKGTATRAQVATVLMQFQNKILK